MLFQLQGLGGLEIIFEPALSKFNQIFLSTDFGFHHIHWQQWRDCLSWFMPLRLNRELHELAFSFAAAMRR